MSKKADYPQWVPPSVVAAAYELSREISTQENSDSAQQILFRLVHDERMRLVWQELYKKKRHNYASSNEYLHPRMCDQPH